MSEEIIIRKAKKEDLKDIAYLFKIESAKKPYFQKWTSKKVLGKIKDAFNSQDIFVIALGKEILGFLTSNIEEDHKKKAYLDELWILEGYQGKGLGRKIMSFVESYYHGKGVKIIHLVSKKSSGAFKFYKKLKYKESEETIFLEKRLK
jgi:ribosomal protein S18 acetylase RimI-like enzyme